MSIFFIIAIGFLAFTLAILMRQDWQFLRQPRKQARGTVFDHRRSVDDGSEYFMAMVRFKTDDGRTIEFTDTFGRPTPNPAVGTELEVVYAVATPENARVRRPGLRIALYVGLGLSLTFLMIGALN